MNEIDKIHTQTVELIKARDHLLNQNPSDMVAVASVTEKIIDLNRRFSALAESGTPIRQLSAAQVVALQRATKVLERAIGRSEAASQIIVAATKVANA